MRPQRRESERIRDQADAQADVRLEPLFAGGTAPLDVLQLKDIYGRLRVARECTVTARLQLVAQDRH